jgi:Flp pilus assembly pilin Flp
MRRILRAFTLEQAGNDLVEYALLASVVGIAGAVALATFPGIMSAVYVSWDTGTQDIWEPLDPQ